jgi:hypothetical protein
MAAFTINTANVLISASGQSSMFQGTAGQTITAGMPLYYDSTNSVYKGANCLNSNTGLVAGIAVDSGNVNQPILICTRDPNFSPGYPIVTGNIALLGNTAGAVQPYEDRTTGWYVTALGVGIGGNRVNFILQGSNVAA